MNFPGKSVQVALFAYLLLDARSTVFYASHGFQPSETSYFVYTFRNLNFQRPWRTTTNLRLSNIQENTWGSESSFETTSRTKGNKVNGLLPEQEFRRAQTLHKTIRVLQRHIPSLLRQPLTESNSANIYTTNTKLIILDNQKNEIQLADSRSELVSISEAIFLASVFATSSVNSLAFTATQQKPKANERNDVEGSILLDPEQLMNSNRENLFLEVEWNVNVLPSFSSVSTGSDKNGNEKTSKSSRVFNQFKGRSMITLDTKDNFKVSSHEIINLKVNDVDVDPISIGQSLSFIRQTTQVVTRQATSAVPFLSQATNIWKQVKDDFLANRQDENDNNDADPIQTPVLIIQPAKPSFNATTATAERIPIDQYVNERQQFISKSNIREIPLPGSTQWALYSLAHQLTSGFVGEIVPKMSGTVFDQEDVITPTLFAAKAQLLSVDGTVLIRDAETLSNFYETLSSFRKRSGGSWNMTNASLLDYKLKKDEKQLFVYIKVVYTSNVNVPTSGAIPPSSPLPRQIFIKGMDVFTISAPVSGIINLADGFENFASQIGKIRIERVEQKDLVLDTGSPVLGSIVKRMGAQNSSWFMNSLVAGVESGSLKNMESSASFIVALVKRLQNPSSLVATPMKTQGVSLLSSQANALQNAQPVNRPDEAAVVVYRIMSSLHNEIPRLVDISSESRSGFGIGRVPKSLVPVQEYLEENVELLGYLDTVLARGQQQYLQIVALVLNTLQVALRSGGVVSDEIPSVVVELTPSGNIKSSVTLSLRVKPLGSFKDILPGGYILEAASADTLPPIKIQVITEYVLNVDSGRIVKHRLVESRVNGQLTPGDVVSRWIQRLVPSTKTNGSTSGSDDPQQMQKLVADGLSWLLSINR